MEKRTAKQMAEEAPDSIRVAQRAAEMDLVLDTRDNRKKCDLTWYVLICMCLLLWPLCVCVSEPQNERKSDRPNLHQPENFNEE